jgi:hypothetical protein
MGCPRFPSLRFCKPILSFGKMISTFGREKKGERKFGREAAPHPPKQLRRKREESKKYSLCSEKIVKSAGQTVHKKIVNLKCIDSYTVENE